MKRWGRSAMGLVVVALAAAPLGAGSAAATTVSRPPDLTATVSATVEATRPPTEGSTPVALTVEGTTSRRPDCLGECVSLREIEVRPDPRVLLDSEGLPTCQVDDVKGYSPSTAQRKCGKAMIGRGTTTETIQFVEVAPVTVASEQFLFNAGGGRVLMYNYVPATRSSGAGLIGTIRRLTLHTGGNAAAVSFKLRFGRAWRWHGEQHHYLSTECRTGVLEQRVTLRLSDGSEASDTTANRCRKRD